MNGKLSILFCAACLLAGCKSIPFPGTVTKQDAVIRRISANEFMAHAMNIYRPSPKSPPVHYIGTGKDRAYLELSTTGPVRKRCIILWVPVSELSAETAQRLRKGFPPWHQRMEQRESQLIPFEY